MFIRVTREYFVIFGTPYQGCISDAGRPLFIQEENYVCTVWVPKARSSNYKKTGRKP